MCAGGPPVSSTDTYPDEAAKTMAALLGDADQSVARLAATYFCDNPAGGYADDLLSALKKSSSRAAGHLSRAVGLLGDNRLLEVVQEKYRGEPIEDGIGFALALPCCAPSHRRLAGLRSGIFTPPPENALSGEFFRAFFVANLVAGTDITRLLLFAIQNKAKDWLPSLFLEVLLKCGSWVSRKDLFEKPAKGRGRKELPLMV